MADIWDLVYGKPSIDAQALADAVDESVGWAELDYRTRLLIRDAVDALEVHWGHRQFLGWLNRSRVRLRIESIRSERFEEVGFPSLKDRLMTATAATSIRQYLRELSTHVQRPTQFVIGRSVALILSGHLSRATEDIDVVDEVPREIREQYQLLDDLQRSYGLQLTHFQSHFLPARWQERTASLEPFGQLQANLVDVYDVFLSKLYSGRDKDRNDLRTLLPALDMDTVKARLRDTCASFLADPTLRRHAEQNWYILTGEALP